jgi:hypothetical protein
MKVISDQKVENPLLDHVALCVFSKNVVKCLSSKGISITLSEIVLLDTKDSKRVWNSDVPTVQMMSLNLNRQTAH